MKDHLNQSGAMSIERLLDGDGDPIDAILENRRHSKGCERGEGTPGGNTKCHTCEASDYYHTLGSEVEKLVEENDRMRRALLYKEERLDELQQASLGKDRSLFRWRMAVAVLAVIAIELRCPGTLTSSAEY